MTREEAINTLRNTAWLGTDDERNNVEEAIEILTTDKGGEIIYRQDAIEAIKNLPRWVMDPNGEFQPVDTPTVSMLDPEDAVSAIENLPSAQLDIVHCPDCKYGVHSGCGDRYICTVSCELRMEHDSTFYCGYGKRRKDWPELRL